MRAFFFGITAVLISPAAASAQVLDFASTSTFGDSLTDNDAIGSGPDPHEHVFRRNAAIGDALSNYAVSGSTSRDLSPQVRAYRDDVRDGLTDPATFVGIAIGNGDITHHVGALAAEPPGVNPAVDAKLDGTAELIRGTADGIVSHHPGGLLVLWTIGDVTKAPLLEDLTEAEAINVRAHIERVNAEIWLEDARPEVIVFDTYAFMQDLVDEPPILRGTTVTLDDLYIDNRHPSALGNALGANEVMQRLDAELGTSLWLFTEEELADIAGFP